MKILLLSSFLFWIGCATIQPDNSQETPVSAGQSTVVFGGCQGNFDTGWKNCLLTRGSKAALQPLEIVFTNPGEWRVSDCQLGVYSEGSRNSPGIQTIALDPLRSQIEKSGFCIIKIETAEKHPAPTDPNQIMTTFHRGGFFIEAVNPGFFPTPTVDESAFCLKVYRTAKGRTKVDRCP